LQNEISEIQGLLDASRDEVSSLRGALAVSRDDLRAQVESLHAQLEQQAKLLQARERLIDEIHRSRAWRITKPLRWLGERLRRLAGTAGIR